MFPAPLRLALGLAKGGPKRNFLLAAIGCRVDGAIVASRNGTSTAPEPTAHAEARVARKLDRGATVYVARVRRDDGEPAMARPCPSCMAWLRSKGVEKVIYTTGRQSYEVFYFTKSSR